MQRFDLIEKLKAAEDQASSIEEEIKAFINNFVEAHRKFKTLQKVEVFDFNERSCGLGFIKRAMCGVSFRWGSIAEQYCGKEEVWLRDLSDIMYEVVKMKKDGTPSERNLLWDKPRQEKRQGGYHLKEIE